MGVNQGFTLKIGFINSIYYYNHCARISYTEGVLAKFYRSVCSKIIYEEQIMKCDIMDVKSTFNLIHMIFHILCLWISIFILIILS